MRHYLIAALMLVCSHAAAATRAPAPIELVHPFPPTGPTEIAGTVAANKVLRTVQRYSAPAFTDILAIHVAQTLQGENDPPSVVTRKPRQGGHDAAVYVLSAAADGRTLLLASETPAAKTGLRSSAGAARELRPVGLVASMPFVLIAGGESRHTSLRAFLRDAQTTRDRVLIGSAAEKGAAHVAIELLRLRHGFPVEPVAHNGGNAALQAVATQQMGAALVPLPAVLPYLGAGRIKALAIAEPRRHPGIPAVPTTAEAGVHDFEAAGWFGVFAPGATPRSVIQDLNARLARSSQSDAARQVFSDLGLRLEHRGADTFAELIGSERHARRGITGIASLTAAHPP